MRSKHLGSRCLNREWALCASRSEPHAVAVRWVVARWREIIWIYSKSCRTNEKNAFPAVDCLEIWHTYTRRQSKVYDRGDLKSSILFLRYDVIKFAMFGPKPCNLVKFIMNHILSCSISLFPDTNRSRAHLSHTMKFCDPRIRYLRKKLHCLSQNNPVSPKIICLKKMDPGRQTIENW